MRFFRFDRSIPAPAFATIAVMDLPILNHPTAPSDTDLMRLYLQTEARWGEHLAEAETIDMGIAFTNPGLHSVYDANRMMDAALPPGMAPADALASVEAHFRLRRTRCAYWILNPSAPTQSTQPLVEQLLMTGHTTHAVDVMVVEHQTKLAPETDDLRIIPARAGFRQIQSLAEASATESGEPKLADAILSHLDDPHWDASIALRDGQAVAMAGVLAVGEVGRIDEVYVVAPLRRTGIGRTMMQRTLAACARAQFRHVMLAVLPDNFRALDLYAGMGFRRIGQIVTYRSPHRP